MVKTMKVNVKRKKSNEIEIHVGCPEYGEYLSTNGLSDSTDTRMMFVSDVVNYFAGCVAGHYIKYAFHYYDYDTEHARDGNNTPPSRLSD